MGRCSVERAIGETSVAVSHHALPDELTNAGGRGATDVGQLFPALMSIGLKMPYRPKVYARADEFAPFTSLTDVFHFAHMQNALWGGAHSAERLRYDGKTVNRRSGPYIPYLPSTALYLAQNLRIAADRRCVTLPT